MIRYRAMHLCSKFGIIVFLQWALLELNGVHCYTIPKPKAVALQPRGFRISIPDHQGVTFFAFHGNINREFRGTEMGEFHGETRQVQRGQWTYQNDRYQLQSGDILYYWIYVQHNRLRYRIDNAKFVYPDDFEQSGTYVRPLPDYSRPSFDHNNGQRPTTNDLGGYRPHHIDNDGRRPISVPDVNSGNNGGGHGRPHRPDVIVPSREDDDEYTTTTTQRTTARPTRTTTGTTKATTTTRTTTTTTTTTTAAPCTATITTVRNEPVRCSGTLIFEEQFDMNVSQRWKPDIRMPLDSEDAEFVLYQAYNEVWNVSNGNLNIFPKLLTDITDFSEERLRNGDIDLGAECTVLQDYNQECRRKAEFARILPPIVSAKLTTRKSFSFKYGKVEIRAKLPKGNWLYPQLLLEPADNSYYGITGFANGQMRVAFIRSNTMLDTKGSIQIDGHRLSGGVILASGEGLRENWLKSSLQENHFADDFHTYTLTWTDQRISLGVDGANYAFINGNFKDLSSTLKIPHQTQWKRGNGVAPFDREFYISLGVAAGGISDFPDGSKTGEEQLLKPWENTSPKAELRFWSSKEEWYPTWNKRESGLIVDYVKVWSI